MENNKKDLDREVSLVIGIFLIILTAIFIIAIGIALWQFIFSQPVSSLPSYMILALFKDSHKMKAVDRRLLRNERRKTTDLLFRGIIWFVVAIVLITLALSNP